MDKLLLHKIGCKLKIINSTHFVIESRMVKFIVNGFFVLFCLRLLLGY